MGSLAYDFPACSSPPIKNQLILVGNNTGMKVVLPPVIAPLTLSFQDEQFTERPLDPSCDRQAFSNREFVGLASHG